MNTRNIAASAAAILSTVHPTDAKASHIDLMNDGAFVNNGAETVVVSGSEDNILGGQRRVSVDLTQARASLTPGSGVLEFTSIGTTEPTLTLEYGDFPGGDPLNADFGSMFDAIVVDMASVSGSGLLSIELESGAGVGASAQTLVSTSGMYVFNFDQPVFNAVDFSDIDLITVRLIAQAGSDFAIASIRTQPIPAPATGALALLGVVALRRRR